MSPVYLNPPPSSPIPFLELKGDQNTIHIKGDQNTIHIVGQRHDQYSTTSDETLALEYARHPQEIKVENSNDNGQVFQSSSWPQNFSDDGGFSHGYASNHSNQNKIDMNTSNDQKYSKKWKPSKVRIMQKMMASSKNMGEQHKLQHSHLERQQSNVYRNNSSDNNNGIRVCTDCHTTTTPLWRSGPRGPKSLCNACGIRQRKARRAAMAAAEAAAFAKEEGVTPMSIDSPKLKAPQDQEMTGENSGFIDNKISHPLPLKKRGKIVEATTSRNYNNNNNNNNRFNTSSNKDYMRATSQRVFPRDEEEGAILLMALSCG